MKNKNRNNINILERKECTGCSVCAQVCPHNCIEMIETKEGFHYPVVDEKLCTDCGLCVKKCHALNDNFKTDFNQEFYDVRANDEIRMKSSSGGMFTLIADYVLEKGGFVCGASWTEDWLGVEHIIIDDKKDLDKLRYSKYMESSLGNIFSEIKKLLNENKLVLFTGAPCQVSALYFYLGKDYENLITVDLLCNSVVPQKVWRKYLRETFNDNDIKDIEYIAFRDKNKFSWGRGLYIKFNNGKEYIKTKYECIYNILFSEHISAKYECLKCKYRKFERVGDITIGDYWGVENSDNKGVSLVSVNSIKGEEVFEKLINRILNIKRVYNVSNGGLSGNIPIFANRKYFFDNLDKEDFETLYNNSNNPKHNVAIANMCFQDNYGGALTYYALYKIIEDFGYNPLLIYDNNIGYVGNNNSVYDNANGNRFALKYMNIANEYFSKEELEKINEKCDTFIVGSDQVWRFGGLNRLFYFLFNFVDGFKKKISYSPSFGVPYFEGELKDKKLFKYYLKQFDSVSVREDDGVRICREFFDVEATHVLDPVFLLESNDYDYLIKKSNLNIDYKYIAVYSRRGNEKLNEYLKFASKKLGLPILKTGKVDIFGEEYDKSFSIEDWLYMIKNCDFFISDSFHGTCFAMIFNKPFILVINNGAISKYKSLIRMFNLQSRTVDNFEDITNNEHLYFEMDWTEINKKLEIEKEKSLKWLKNALENKKEKYNYKDDIINYLIEENKEKDNKINCLHNENLELKNKIVNLYFNNTELYKLYNSIFEKQNWIKLFGIYNTKEYLIFYLFGIKISFKMNEERVNKLAWWIPIRKWRDGFRNKFFK